MQRTRTKSSVGGVCKLAKKLGFTQCNHPQTVMALAFPHNYQYWLTDFGVPVYVIADEMMKV